MAKITVELEIDCKEKTCGCCQWIYGESMGDPFCGLFEYAGGLKLADTTLGKYKAPRHLLNRLPECVTAEVKEVKLEQASLQNPR